MRRLRDAMRAAIVMRVVRGWRERRESWGKVWVLVGGGSETRHEISLGKLIGRNITRADYRQST